jgi:hypothetical protein
MLPCKVRLGMVSSELGNISMLKGLWWRRGIKRDILFAMDDIPYRLLG